MKIVKALSVVKLEEEDEVSLFALLPESYTQGGTIPLTQAMRDNPLEWQAGLRSKLNSLIDAGTFKILKGPPPPGINPRSCKIVLKDKLHTDGTVARKKGRIVVRGFEQQWGIDYNKTFVSVVRYNTLRALLAKAAIEDLEIDHLDVDTVFLNANCEEEIYMEVPDYFEMVMPGITRQTHYLQLLKSLYGLKQAPRAWFELVKSEFHKLGLKASDADPNLFIGTGVFILLFVDDMLLIGARPELDAIEVKINNLWKCKVEPATVFVGFQIVRDRSKRTLRIHQEAYTTRLLKKLGISNCNLRALPIAAGTVLKSTEHDLDRY